MRDVALQINTLGVCGRRATAPADAYLEQHDDMLDADARGVCTAIRCVYWTARIRRCRRLIEAAPKLMDELDEASLKHFEAVQACCASRH